MKRKMWKGFNMELLKFHPKGQPLMQPKTNPLNQLECTILTRIKNCYVEFFERIFLMCLKFWNIYTIIVFVVLRNVHIFLVMVEFSCWCPQEHWNPFFLIFHPFCLKMFFKITLRKQFVSCFSYVGIEKKKLLVMVGDKEDGRKGNDMVVVTMWG